MVVELIRLFWPQIVWTLGVIGACGGMLIRWMRKKFSESDARAKAVECGVQALLRDRIIQAYYHYTERESITLHGLEAVEAMYTEYHRLGGNGTVTKLMDDIRELNVEEKGNNDG